MFVANLSSTGTPSSMKSEEGTDPLDTFIRQTFGAVSLTPFSMPNGSPVQLVQFLNGLEGPGLNNQNALGWPLTSQTKMQKCEKCSREFWSPINYRRHVRVHLRSLKESHENRDLLAAFWDRLSLEQRKDLMSFSGVMLKDIPGLKIITALTSSLHPPTIWNFPPVCVDAGSALVDIIQAKPSRLLIPSHELFNVLDGASEGTFLCAGTAQAVQKYVFEGNTAKNSLELNNLVASTGFLFEQQLVKAWFADKDAEALRCQKLLVEEEEAAQRRQAAVLEKKRQKKLRKEQKMKEISGDKQVLDVVDSTDSHTLADTFDLSSPPDFKSSSPDAPQNIDSTLESLQFEADTVIEPQLDLNSERILENSETNETHVVCRNGARQLTSENWQVRESQKAARPRFNVGQNRQKFKPELIHKHATPRNLIQQNRSQVWTKNYKHDSDKNGFDQPAFKEETTPQIEEDECDDVIIGSIQQNRSQVWTKNYKDDSDKNGSDLPAFKEETTPQIEEDKCDDVIIGSIPVTLKHRCKDVIIGSIPIKLKINVSSLEEKNAKENLTKTETLQPPPYQVVSKLCGPVSCGENENSVPLGRVNGHDQAISGEKSHSTKSDYDNQGEPLVSSNADVLEGSLPFCSASAEEFVAGRLTEANSAEHVKLVIPSQTELPPSRCVQNHKTASQVSDSPKHSVLGNAENNQVGVGAQVKHRKKADKEMKAK